jgi:ammonia channel protein AmtB
VSVIHSRPKAAFPVRGGLLRGRLAAILVMWFRTKKWDTTAIINGFLAGLMGIACRGYWVSGLGAFLIGAVAGVLVIVAMECWWVYVGFGFSRTVRWSA